LFFLPRKFFYLKNTNPSYWCKPNGEVIVKINIHADKPLLNFGFNVMQKYGGCDPNCKQMSNGNCKCNGGVIIFE
jgi:hypothetical protein